MENQEINTSENLNNKYNPEQWEKDKRLFDSLKAMIQVAAEDEEKPEILSVCRKIKDSDLMKQENVSFKKMILDLLTEMDDDEKYYFFYCIIIPYYLTCLEMAQEEKDEQTIKYLKDSSQIAEYLNKQLGFGFFNGEKVHEPEELVG